MQNAVLQPFVFSIGVRRLLVSHKQLSQFTVLTVLLLRS
jgi:hypothetical protein